MLTCRAPAHHDVRSFRRELGTIESICLTIVAGFSVDYVVHLAHAYMHSPAQSRTDRVQHALGEMGITVLSGMATTVLASVPLFLCILVFFAKFGSFMCMTVVLFFKHIEHVFHEFGVVVEGTEDDLIRPIFEANADLGYVDGVCTHISMAFGIEGDVAYAIHDASQE